MLSTVPVDMWQRIAVTDDLVSGAEIGRRLGVSREAVRKWAKTPERRFPAPLARVGRSIVWDWADVKSWADVNGYTIRGAA
jgi:predicted DNA-binding transcriptional regulator AlpA